MGFFQDPYESNPPVLRWWVKPLSTTLARWSPHPSSSHSQSLAAPWPEKTIEKTTRFPRGNQHIYIYSFGRESLIFKHASKKLIDQFLGGDIRYTPCFQIYFPNKLQFLDSTHWSEVFNFLGHARNPSLLPGHKRTWLNDLSSGFKQNPDMKFYEVLISLLLGLPSRELTYPTLGKGKSSSKCHFWGIC